MKKNYTTAKTQETLLRRFKTRGSRHFESKFTMDKYDWLYRKTIQYASKKGPCLDWGCGTGHFSLFLQENNYQDVSGCAFEEPLMLNILNEKNYNFTKIDNKKPHSFMAHFLENSLSRLKYSDTV